MMQKEHRDQIMQMHYDHCLGAQPEKQVIHAACFSQCLRGTSSRSPQ
ncbi:hypothetical protein J4410_02190 [Candidatus Woesearchaeota archaeon]|nr:hypothetical protein [Candidatus Woesearchaeota archaeon]